LRKAQIALEIEQAGQLLTVTELRSARMYWHVSSDHKIKIYPSSYTPRTIGILWQTMAQCQTWFGSAAYLAYGIQLLPITPIVEYRDTVSWSKEMYHIFAGACSADPACTANGWSVIQLALLGIVGHQQDSADLAISLPAEVFDSAGGNGHSLTNTLWFLSTRPEVESPLPLTKAEISASAHIIPDDGGSKVNQVTDCGRPGVCTDYVLDTIAGEYTCRQRMNWLVQQMSQTEAEACNQIAVEENPYECGACDPNAVSNDSNHTTTAKCSQCTHEQCDSDLNRCPLFDATFVCTEGDSIGGCSRTPWDVPSQQCRECCELTHCVKPSPAELRAKNELHCPPCTQSECKGMANRCERYDGLQYLCLDGPSEGGCALLPWAVRGVQCSKCCTIVPHCGN
jgi:Glycosyl hydrolase family 81 C-terminal domain